MHAAPPRCLTFGVYGIIVTRPPITDPERGRRVRARVPTTPSTARDRPTDRPQVVSILKDRIRVVVVRCVTAPPGRLLAGRQAGRQGLSGLAALELPVPRPRPGADRQTDERARAGVLLLILNPHRKPEPERAGARVVHGDPRSANDEMGWVAAAAPTARLRGVMSLLLNLQISFQANPSLGSPDSRGHCKISKFVSF